MSRRSRCNVERARIWRTVVSMLAVFRPLLLCSPGVMMSRWMMVWASGCVVDGRASHRVQAARHRHGKDDETGDLEVDSMEKAMISMTSVSAEGAPAVEWHVGEGTSGEEHVHEGLQTADGGYVAIGRRAVGAAPPTAGEGGCRR